MKLQSGTTGCGSAALANALQALGFDIEQEAVAKLADTNGDGTNARGLKRAATSLGVKVKVIRSGFQTAYYELLGHLHAAHAAILIVDKNEHWVTVVGVFGGEVLLVDPAMMRRQFVNMISKEELQEIWSTSGECYAIVVYREDL